ncbi:hypothetical protein TI39_contig4126g00012 [Zymoseptoria brevis]|uniref:chitinase n=1 Tax=Zymoseptoria brevis TaxID=1047168 RepID=A0A0F4GCW5_9PEZI|nr:hypothetical protein TI39_contig4126g00012 [Zymoseptoria brevis]
MAFNRGTRMCTILLVLFTLSQTVVGTWFDNHMKHKDTPLAARQLNGSVGEPGECPYLSVVAGDTCISLADKCGNLTISDFQSYNGAGNSPDYNATFCGALDVNQVVCCGAGNYPDFTPKPNPDGSCIEWTVKANDTCTDVGILYNTTVEAIERVNANKTWGFGGCYFLIPGQKICLSEGTPPFPAPVDNAQCGPQIDGTAATTNITGWADLNPCPNKACCNKWAQCGITGDFCIPERAYTGAPGSAPPGKNGCISNCGMEIISSPEPPAVFEKIGYFETWNQERPGLHMWPRDINSNGSYQYTTVHYAFMNIIEGYEISAAPYEDNWNEFLNTTGFKKIVTFGGWAFSTENFTYNVFRDGVTTADRQKFAQNVARFVIDNKLDGVDFDWEYPGAPDIPGIPPASPENGRDYLEFLKIVRQLLPAPYTVSVAIPASYWYLKGFPIEEMAPVLDYMVAMTYDLHGQWDYGNNYSQPGCPTGDCLRSHVNQTETEQALSMITKAGVPSNKVIFGQALYGRSFRMTTPGCYTSQCKYTGPESGAAKGVYTGTSGYISNYEIRQIIANGTRAGALEGRQIGETPSTYYNVQEYYSPDMGNVLVYNDVEWVSWTDDTTYNNRTEWVRALNFGGIVDWAMDLNATFPDRAVVAPSASATPSVRVVTVSVANNVCAPTYSAGGLGIMSMSM